MIYDKIDNLKTYTCLSDDIRVALEYLRQVTPEVEKGVHEINPRVKAIVSEYTTKLVNENGYEAHRQYIDIQYLVRGAEKMCCLPLEYLEETTPYNGEGDAALYKEKTVCPQNLLLGNGYFAILFPQDGHMPGLCVDAPLPVKKIVIKVRIPA